jgi:DNA-binding transcriptional ArsR family regulator
MRIVPHPETEQLHLAGVLHALSDPVRLEIVWTLNQTGEVPCGGIEVGISKSTLTHHLKVLRDAGLTLTRCEGVQRLVSLRREDIDSRFPGLLDLVLANAPASVTDAPSAQLLQV